MEYSFQRYLAAKKSVDDRALNRHVWHTLRHSLPFPSVARPLDVLELGAGIGTMLERMVEWDLLRQARVLALDVEPANIAEACRRLLIWADHTALSASSPAANCFTLRGPELDLAVQFEAIDLFDFIALERGRRQWDVLVAHAVLDLLDLAVTVPRLLTLVRPGGLLYLTIIFDGDTILQPELDRDFDDAIAALYHRTMDERLANGRPSGDSRTGRHLFQAVRTAGGTILDAGSSDWVVFAGADGYPADEAYFLHFIIETMRSALIGNPALDAGRFGAWIEARHAQIERGELVYIAHQLDFLVRAPATGASAGQAANRSEATRSDVVPERPPTA